MADLNRIFGLLAIAVAALYLILAVVGGYLYVNAQNQRDDIRAQAVASEKLSQALCKTYSRSRIVGNRTIREPIKAGLMAQVKAFKAAASDRGNDPAARKIYRHEAKKLQAMADRVKPVGVVPCSFGKED